MIYAGLIQLNDNAPNRVDELKSALHSFTQTPPSVLQKKSLILCYGKLSDAQDLDDVWENNSSVLMGRIFDKINHCSYDKDQFKSLSHLSTENVLEKVWGKYVYIHIKDDACLFKIVLDSTGQLPFFYYPLPDGNILFSSNVEVIYQALSQNPDYNWTYFFSYLVYGNSSSTETPFNNIYELPAACSLKLTRNSQETKPFWDPFSSYRTAEGQKQNAVDVLETTLKPWIEPYQNICVSLSGGLDSSALVYCLNEVVRQDQTLNALNYFHSQIKSSNELAHARKVCQETGIELIEIDASSSLPFDPPKRKQPLKPNKPFPGLVSSRWMETIFDYLPSDKACAFVSGHGSDHIFMRPPSKRSASDFILEKGLKGSKKTLDNMAQFYRAPHFSILKENFKALLSYFLNIKEEKRNIKDKILDIPHWIKQEVIQNTSSSFYHPIYQHLCEKIIPGKYNQIDAFYEGLASIHVEMTNQADPTYYPYLYQPVVEFALSFPTYDLFDKGYDRYPLRKAVSDHFKTETVWRRDKSQTTGLFQLGVKQNLKQVLELCLEGHFVKQGHINKEQFHKTITQIGNGDTKHMWPFTHIAAAELFLRQWERKS